MRDRIRNILLESIAFNERPNINDAFWKWFGDSKVVDASGDPLVVYHGSNNSSDGFRVFRNSIVANDISTNKDVIIKKSIWFSDSYEYVDKIGRSNIQQFYLSAKNPLDLRKLGCFESEKKLMTYFVRIGKKKLARYFSPDDDYDIPIYDIPKMAKRDSCFIDDCVEYGYDGIIILECLSPSTSTSYVVFSSTQIKSVDNNGMWSINDPDTMK